MKRTSLMKQNVFVTFMLLLWSINAFSATYTSKVTVTNSGQGKVYIDNSQKETASQTDGNSGARLEFELKYVPNRGYIFDAWTFTTSNAEFSAGYTGLSNPTKIVVPATQKNGTVDAKVTATTSQISGWSVEYIPVATEEYLGGDRPGWYRVSGPTRGTSYGAADIKTSSQSFNTYPDDDVTLTATCTNNEYQFSQFYALDANGTKSRLGDAGVASQTVFIPEGTVQVGAEFTRPFYVTFIQSTIGGTYSVTGPDNYVSSGVSKVTMPSSPIYTEASYALSFKATPNTAEGYTLLRYYATDADGNVTTLGKAAIAEQTINIDRGPITVCAEFTKDPYVIGERTFATLEAALFAVQNTVSKTILVVKDVEVPAGTYTIPAGVTLLVPKNQSQVSPESKIQRVADGTANTKAAYRTLTLKNGVNLNVYGTIELGGTQDAQGQGAVGAGIPYKTYGQLIMEEGSKITINGDARLFAWGFVTGAGQIEVRRKGVVFEQFQMYDWKGGTITTTMLGNNELIFPVNQYFIQNVEVETTYHPGSALHASTSVNLSGAGIVAADVQIIGIHNRLDEKPDDIAMFLMDDRDNSEDTWVRKKYDVATDRQVYDVNSSAKIGSMIIAIDDYIMNSQEYVLPITNNLKVHLLTGQMEITQSTVMFPGSEIEIDKTATVSIKSGQSLYLYDIAQWGKYVFSNTSGQAYACRIKYRPGTTPTNSVRDITALSNDTTDKKIHSAAINVHGTFDVQGALYTTEGGANIYSSNEDAGTVYFSRNAPSDGKVCQPTSAYETKYRFDWPFYYINYVQSTCPSAKLKNASGYKTTKGEAKTGDSYCYILDAWRNLKTDGCFVYEVLANETIYYAKPADYVALANGKTENADHTYSSADGTRTFILLGDCQWWEVVYDTQSGLYYCDKNDTYYYYSENDCWEPKTYKIYWVDWDGSPINYTNAQNEVVNYYELKYGSTPKFLGSKDPTRDEDPGYYTYDFIGWAPAFASVTKDETYTAQYDRKPIRYTITWLNSNNTVREVGDFRRDSIPVCKSEPADMSLLEWTPTIAPVTGPATYKLQAKDLLKTTYTVTYKNRDGNILKKQDGVSDAIYESGTKDGNGYASTPHYDGEEPFVDPDDMPEDMNLVWDTEHPWLPEWTSTINGDKVYVAQFKAEPKTYTITWNWADGEDAEHSTTRVSNGVAYNSFPQYTDAETPHKDLGDNYNYMFSGWNTSINGGGSGIGAATGDITYYAQYIAVPKNRTIDAEEAIAASTIQEVTTLTITATGQLTIPGTSRIDATNLILEATENSSGELFATNTSINATNVYYDLTLDTDRRHWRAFGVPWPVGDLKVTKLVEVKNRAGAECHRELALGRDYDIMYYNGAYRAAHGPGAACWEYVQDHGNTLTPGQGYMIAFTSEVGTIRFTKAAMANVVYNSTSLPIVENTGDPNDPNANWNAIANPMPYHSLMNVGALLVQVHDGGEIGSDGYKNAPADGKYVVGKMVYFQAPTAKSTVAISKADGESVITPFAAPARRTAEREVTLDDFYHVELLNVQGVKNADVFIRAEEDKQDAYYIGKDVACMGLTSARAQMWVNRYNVKLCMNTTAPINDVAEFSISVYAPSNGEYTIRLNNQPDEDYTLYLTRDGEAIWDLSMGDYVMNLNSGVHKNYGLRLSANKAPEVVTGIDEAIVDAQGDIRKVLINNNVYIIRGGEVYTVTGAKIQ